MFIYKLYDKNNSLLYIGKTVNIHNRMRDHFYNVDKQTWKNEIEYAEFSKCDNETDMNIYEVYYINLLKPMHNKGEVYNAPPSFKLKDLVFKKYNKETTFNYSKITDVNLGKLLRLYNEFKFREFTKKEAEVFLKVSPKTLRSIVKELNEYGFICLNKNNIKIQQFL